MVLVFQLSNGVFSQHSEYALAWLQPWYLVCKVKHTWVNEEMLLNCLLESWMGRNQLRGEVLWGIRLWQCEYEWISWSYSPVVVTARINSHKVDINLVKMGSLLLEMLKIHFILPGTCYYSLCYCCIAQFYFPTVYQTCISNITPHKIWVFLCNLPGHNLSATFLTSVSSV